MSSAFDFMSGPDLDVMDSWPAGMPSVVTDMPVIEDPGILAELSLITSIATAPSHPSHDHALHRSTLGDHGFNQNQHDILRVSSPVTPPAGFSNQAAPSQPFQTHASTVYPLKRKASSLSHNLASQPFPKKPLLSNFATSLALSSPSSCKQEPTLLTTPTPYEPLTPSVSQSPYPGHASASQYATYQVSAVLPPPLSPLSDSGCSEDDEEPDADQDSLVRCPVSPLPTPSAPTAARRRAARTAALARSRSRAMASRPDVCSSATAVYSTPSVAASTPSAHSPRCTPSPHSSFANNEGEDDDVDGAPLDKKVARAIRNRQAAQRSRVEAKAKMQKLAEDNDNLAARCASLAQENASLNKQLSALLAHTFGEGHDVNDVLTVFSGIKDVHEM
jgi:hypothetical protein